ncbi:MAG TPA: spore protease YyaC [Syntrophomonadaceae bacterium]|jgi:putative sporulation protein YyaC|nr:spore protease YyaC [Syntrophomonadaceae bacterium]HRX21686.1 spore protease YyaC [Syntrophomonadaceae bacterium]
MIEDTKGNASGMIMDTHYKDPHTGERLLQSLQQICVGTSTPPLFICIGSDRHILDCFGPLIGTMVKQENQQIIIYGHLEEPLHAQNISKEIEIITSRHPDSLQIAIDASVGSTCDVGNIKVRQGPIIPGKALAKKLPPIGDYAITGVLGSHQERSTMTGSNQGSLAAVYPMAKIIAEAICTFHRQAKD